MLELTQVVGRIQQMNKAKRDKNLLLLSFRQMQRRTILSKIIKVKQLAREKDLCSNIFYTWTVNAKFSKRYQHMVGERNESLKLRAIKAWKNYTSVRQAKLKNYVNLYWKSQRSSLFTQNVSILQAKIDQRYREFLIKAGLLAFKKHYRLFNHQTVDLRKREKQATNYYRLRQKRFFYANWKHCIYHVLVPKRQKQNRAACLYIKSLLKTGLSLFKKNLKVNCLCGVFF